MSDFYLPLTNLTVTNLTLASSHPTNIAVMPVCHTLKRSGTLVSIADVPLSDLAQELGIRAIQNATLPTIQQLFRLQEAPAAHVLCKTGHGRGRIVLHIHD